MADGNINRNILPYNNYRSGLRAGRSTERARAVRVFADMVESEGLAATPDEAARLVQKFHDMLFAEE